MSCPYERIHRLALDPLEQLRREIELDTADEPEVRAPSTRDELDVFELVWVEDINAEENEEESQHGS
jgi:hypothetical protein